MHHSFSLKRVKQVQIGDIIYFEEDVFIKNNNKFAFLGKRCTICKVMAQYGSGKVLCKIIKSAGANAEPAGLEIEKPIGNLLSGTYFTDTNFNKENLQAGGHLEGEQNGKKVIMDDASKGGMSVGSKHTDGGIQGTVGSHDKPIEFEGEEIILTAPVASNPKTYDIEGELLTGRQIASKINQDNGGVAIMEDGGQAGSCRCSGKMYKFGGTAISDSDIIKYINFMNQSVQDRILSLKK